MSNPCLATDIWFLLIGIVVGASSSWYISRHFYYKSKLGTVSEYTAAAKVNCSIEEAWRRITDPANIGNLAWSSPTLPDGAELAADTEINHAPHGVGGLYVIDVEEGRTILMGDVPGKWDKAIRLASSVNGTHVSYTRRFQHRGTNDQGAETDQGLANWDLQRLMVCFRDLS